MKKLENKWALVTGSSRGIGQQIAVGLAREGCHVVVHGRDIEHLQPTLSLLRDHGVRAHAVAGDLSNEDGIAAVIEGVRRGPGHVDILYNNAAIQNPWRDIWNITAEEWRTTFQINLFALIPLCHAFAPEMKRRGYGRIINLTSGIGDTPQLAPYSVSKAAVDKYSRCLAEELRGTNVLVNTLDPGWLRTDMGGENATSEVETVLPGALVPALLENNGPSGQAFSAQAYREQ
jgi:NAD(P)-dependent dehydrogenase (short-subunit alcohol dehydrogenase family)